MPRSKRSAILDSRNKRLALEVGKRFLEPIQSGSYLLYQRPLNGAGGSWLARWYDPDTRKQKQSRLGSADDFTTADGTRTLTYLQAQDKAKDWFKVCASNAVLEADGEVVPKGPYSVSDALCDYLSDALRRGMKGYDITQKTASAHILPALGKVPVSKLTKRKIESWHLALAESPRRKTGVSRDSVQFLKAPATEDDKRKRKNTANRILTVL